jgi:two-component system, LytTR family, sensor histidine kinase AlgZ
MIEPCQQTPPQSNDLKSTLGLVEGVFRAAWVVPSATVLAAVLLLVIGHAHISEVGRKFLFSLIYSAVIGVPSAILVTWIAYHFPRRHKRLLLPALAGVLLITATTGCLGAGIIFQIVRIVPRSEYWFEFRSSFPFAAVITLVTGLSITSFETLRHRLQSATLELRTREVEQERANKLVAEARLSSLESRIHPHFLFNTLNSIAALIPSDPKRAEDTVGKLASLLRFSLNANQASLVPLAQEIKIVRDYLEIERTRFGMRLRYEIEIPEGLEAIKVPPLALQSLVENCIKHVVAQRAEGATIRVTASREDGRVRLQVMDDGPGFSLEAITPEHGLGNLIARLQLLFGERAQLELSRKDERTVVSLLFPEE